MIRSGIYENACNSYNTPEWLLDMFPDAFDPCPYDEDWDESKYDGLRDDWKGQLIFVNPPYSDVMPWVDKALEHRFKCNMMGEKCTIVMLLRHDSSTKWYAKLHSAGAKFLMIQGRLKFTNGKTNMRSSMPSVLVIL